MGGELIALNMLAARLKEHLSVPVEIVPYAYCDKHAAGQEFAALNHKPRHVMNDIMERDFNAGTSHCSTCGADHDSSPNGVDLNV